MYLMNFTENNKKFCLSLHDNGANSHLFVTGKEIHKFKAEDSDIVTTPLEWSGDNTKKTGLNEYVHDFSVDYDTTAVCKCL